MHNENTFEKDGLTSFDSYAFVLDLVLFSSEAAIKHCVSDWQEKSQDPKEIARIVSLSEKSSLDISRNKEHGDFATNIAMVLAKELKKSPRDIAKLISEKIAASPHVDKVDIAGPGFINIFMKKSFWQRILQNFQDHFHLEWHKSAEKRNDMRKSKYSSGDKNINIEFVSANPTGPMHLGHARSAVYGDVLHNLLKYFGNKSTKEYYINDSGNQTKVLVKSLWLRYLEVLGQEVTMPEECYPGEYLIESAKALYKERRDSLVHLQEAEREIVLYDFAIKDMLKMIRQDLRDLGVCHDVFVSEKKDIVDKGRVAEAIQKLKDKGLVYQGCLDKPLGHNDKDWKEEEQTIFRSTLFGDDEDRVLVKANGEYTYFAPDIAYHYYKYERGFNDMLLLLGADHAGYIKRLKATVSALSDSKASINILLTQMIKLFKDGESIKMSKRSGNFIALRDVIDDLGRDIIRFLMLWRKCDSHFEIDVNKAKEQSKDNPVFYVQYAHTRAKSIIEKARKEKLISDEEFIIEDGRKDELSTDILYNAFKEGSASAKDVINFALLDTEQEIALIKKISLLEQSFRNSLDTTELHKIAHYVYDLAGEFNSLWNQGERFISSDIEISRARIALAYSLAKAIGSSLILMGIQPLLKM